MRIGLVTDTYTPQVNGVTTVLRRMVSALTEGGHEPLIVAPRYPGQRRPDPGRMEHRVGSIPFPPYPAIRLSLPFSGSAVRFLDDARPELIHVITEGPLGLLGRRYALARSLPLVTSFHTNFPQYSRHYGAGALEPLVWRWLRWFHGPARLTQTPGEAVRDELVARGIEPAMVWGRGVDSRFFNPGRRDELLRQNLGVGPGEVLVLHVGRLAPEKNLKVLAEAWEIVRGALGGGVRFLIAGAGPAESMLTRRIPWATRLGFLSGDELAALYASADVCVLPSRTETCGLVALEAMASGLAVVAAYAGGFRESIVHGENGLLVNADDGRAFAWAIIDLCRDSLRRSRLGQEGRRAAVRRDIQLEDRELLDLYAGLIRAPITEAACAA